MARCAATSWAIWASRSGSRRRPSGRFTASRCSSAPSRICRRSVCSRFVPRWIVISAVTVSAATLPQARRTSTLYSPGNASVATYRSRWVVPSPPASPSARSVPPDDDRGEEIEQTVPAGSWTAMSMSASPVQARSITTSRTKARSTAALKSSASAAFPAARSRSMVAFASRAARVATSCWPAGQSWASTPGQAHRRASTSSVLAAIAIARA